MIEAQKKVEEANGEAANARYKVRTNFDNLLSLPLANRHLVKAWGSRHMSTISRGQRGTIPCSEWGSGHISTIPRGPQGISCGERRNRHTSTTSHGRWPTATISPSETAVAAESIPPELAQLWKRHPLSPHHAHTHHNSLAYKVTKLVYMM